MAGKLPRYQVLFFLEKAASTLNTAVSLNGALYSVTGSRLTRLMVEHCPSVCRLKYPDVPTICLIRKHRTDAVEPTALKLLSLRTDPF
jgi:hypothetical protein